MFYHILTRMVTCIIPKIQKDGKLPFYTYIDGKITPDVVKDL